MFMQTVGIRFILTMSGIGICFILFARALIRVPMFIIDSVTFIYLVIGIVPIVFLNNTNRLKYLLFSFFMSGAGGLWLLAESHLQYSISIGMPFNKLSTIHTSIAIICYASYLVAGVWWIWIRKIKD